MAALEILLSRLLEYIAEFSSGAEVETKFPRFVTTCCSSSSWSSLWLLLLLLQWRPIPIAFVRRRFWMIRQNFSLQIRAVLYYVVRLD